MHDIAGWVKAGVAAAVATGTVIFAVGGDRETLRETKAQLATVTQEHKVDHDQVIELRAKLGAIDERTKEIQADVKTLLGETRNDRSQTDAKRRTR